MPSRQWCYCQLDWKVDFGSVAAYKEPVIYNLAVTRELLKQIYIKEGLHPPSIAAFRESYSAIFAQVFNPGFVGSLIRNGEIGRVGIYGLQAYGIFKVSNGSCFSNQFVKFYLTYSDGRNRRSPQSSWLQTRLDHLRTYS